MTDKLVSLGIPHRVLRGPWEKIGILKTADISPFEDPKKQIEEIQNFAPQVAYGFPSCVSVLAKEILERGLQGIKIPLIFASGELVDYSVRELADEAFGAELFDSYGAVEVGKVARECVRHNGFHVWSNRVLVDVIIDGKSASVGEEGEITVTNLNQYAMPFLRYNLQDIGFLMEDQCSCGNPFPLFQITGGRKSDLIWLLNGSTIGATAVYTSLNRIQGTRQFQVIQEKPDRFIVKIVKDSQFTDATSLKIRALMREMVGDVEIAVVAVDVIPREKSGKFRPFIPLKA